MGTTTLSFRNFLGQQKTGQHRRREFKSQLLAVTELFADSPSWFTEADACMRAAGGSFWRTSKAARTSGAKVLRGREMLRGESMQHAREEGKGAGACSGHSGSDQDLGLPEQPQREHKVQRKRNRMQVSPEHCSFIQDIPQSPRCTSQGENSTSQLTAAPTRLKGSAGTPTVSWGWGDKTWGPGPPAGKGSGYDLHLQFRPQEVWVNRK